MMNNFIGGGQIFIHKIRMLAQVLHRSFTTALLISLAILVAISYQPAQKIDWQAVMTYQKALLVNGFDAAMRDFKATTNHNSQNSYTKIDAFDKRGVYARDVDPRKIIKITLFKRAYNDAICFFQRQLLICAGIMLGIFLLIYFMWSKFGKEIRQEKHVSGATIKTAKEVAKYLKSSGKASMLKIGGMPLVKNSETKHTLITGTTGSGKTNLINNLLPQLVKAKMPALVVDQTGEMIARYYDPARGDIIFNPLDARTHTWDFWADNACDAGDSADFNPRLEKFAKVLFKYGKKPHAGGDPFWDNSAEVIFCACVEHLLKSGNKSITALQKMLSTMSLSQLEAKLAGSKATRYLSEGNKTTASSILSVMATSTKPLALLTESERQFSLAGRAADFATAPPFSTHRAQLTQ